MSDIRINFDTAGNIETPTLVLAYRNAKKIDTIVDPVGLNVSDSFGNPTEFSFEINKRLCLVWDQLIDYRLIWVQEWDKWFTIKVEISEDDITVKNVYATHLPESELGQLNLYDTEINTEDDMLRDDYDENLPTIFFRRDHHEASLLHRVTQKAVNFEIIHVDESLSNLQQIYEFSFDNISIYDALLEIAQEVKCIFIFGTYINDNGRLVRTISVYDLQDYCQDCGHREDFMETCPECNSINIISGYGEDTGIFLSIENALEGINYSTNIDSLKNCFKLEAGDDDMTFAVMGCNPTGSDYLWHFSDDMKKNDISPELNEALDAYQEQYDYYFNEYNVDLDADAYNALLDHYNAINEETQKNIYTTHNLENIKNPLVGYSALTNVLYDTLDMNLYLEHSLMPFVENKLEETSAELQLQLLNEELSTVAVSTNSGITSETTVENAITSMAKVIVDSRYNVSVNYKKLVNTIIDSETQKNIESEWEVRFTITNKSNEDDTASTTDEDTKTVYVNMDNELFMEQKIEKQLSKGDNFDYSIIGLFELDIDAFEKELEKYSLAALERFLESANGVLSVLTEQGVNNPGSFPITDPNGLIYNNLYLPYYEEKIPALENAIALRESEITIVTDLQTQVKDIRSEIAEKLNLETYLGELLWSELNAFRREDTYSNANYIAEGKNNAEIFKLANEFLNRANEEIIKASTLQHTISTSLINIFADDNFKELREGFKTGNWLRIGVEDEVYKLRLLVFDLNYDDYQSMSIDFSDVERIKDAISDVESVIDNMNTISTSFDYVEYQALKSSKQIKSVNSIFSQGLDLTNTAIMNSSDQVQTWDSNGMLFREYDDQTDSYLDTQMKIINSTIAITDDNWKTIKTALGKFYYVDPLEPDEVKIGYGINGEVLVGKVIIGETLTMANESGNLTFNQNGLSVYNDFNKVVINPNDPSSIFTIQKISGGTTENLLTFNEGNLEITGTIYATDGEFTGKITTGSGEIAKFIIKDDYLYSGGTGLSSSADRYAFWAGETNSKYGVAGGIEAGGSDAAFFVDHDGFLYAQDANIEGIITATELYADAKGRIGCWTFDSDSSMYDKNETAGVNSYGSGMAFWAGRGTGHTGNKAPFRVGHDGKLHAEGADITGTIKADSFSADTSYKLHVGQVENTIIQASTWDSNEVASFTLGTGNCRIQLTSDKNGYGMIHIYAPYGVVAANDAYFQGSDFKLNDGSGTSLKYHSHTHVQNKNGYRVYLTNNDNVNFIPAQNFGTGAEGDRCQGIISLGSDYNYFKNINYSGELDKISDRRVKNDFGDLSIEESKLIINGLKLKKFTYKTDDMSKLHYGIYAQDLRDLLIKSDIECNAALSIFDTTQDRKTLDLYLNEDNASYSVDYTQFIPLNIKVTQQHEKDISNLIISGDIQNNRITELENKIKYLEQQIKQLTA